MFINKLSANLFDFFFTKPAVYLFLFLFNKTKFPLKIFQNEKNLNLLLTFVDKVEIKHKFDLLFKNIQVKQPLFFQLERFGSKNDGGYTIAKLTDPISAIMSFGVGTNIDFELYFAKLGAIVLLFDGTIKKLPVNNPNFYFIPKNICGNKVPDIKEISFVKINDIFGPDFQFNQYSLETIRSFGTNMILMMDIEGAEYDVLASIETNNLNQFSQIAIEFHGLYSELFEEGVRINECFKILNQTHELIVIHANNYGAYLTIDEFDYPDVIETTWLRKDLSTFKSTKNEFNIKENYPNNPKSRDLKLYW
jgi:hypothetical protein